MWLFPRTDAENGVPCFRDQSVTDIVTHIWLDESKWKLVQRQHSNGPDELMASLPYAGGLPVPCDMWHFEPPLGISGVLSVHILTWSQYKLKHQEEATEPKDKQLSKQSLESMQHDVNKMKEIVTTWEVNRGTLLETVVNVSEIVVTLKRRQDSCDDELKALHDQIQLYYSEASPILQKKAKRCFCDGRSRAVTKRDGTSLKAMLSWMTCSAEHNAP